MARTPAEVRARRLIALIGLLKPDAELSLSALAEQLGATPAELATDLETLAMCGIAPYDPLALVPVFVDGDTVEVFGEVPALRAGVRLSAAEARALSTALQAAGFGSHDALTAKLVDAATGSFDAEQLERIVRSAVGEHQGSVYETLAHAVRDREVLLVEYANAGVEEPACREVEPISLFADRGAWYLDAWCRTARARRTFRIDRMRAATVTGEVFDEGRAEATRGATAFDTTGLPTATLRFANAADYSDREWPGSSSVVPADADGGLLVEVPFAGTGWISRMVVARLGSVVVESPGEVRAAVRDLARTLRARSG